MRTLGFAIGVAAAWSVACGNHADENGNTNGVEGSTGGALGGGGVTQLGTGGFVQVGAGGAGTPGPGGTTNVGGAGQPPGGGGASTIVPGSGGSTGAGGGTSADLDPPGTVILQTDSFDLEPGQEAYRCQNFDNPFGGQDTAVGRIVTDMTPGSHHLHVYNLTEGTSRSLEVCDISDFHALVHAAGSPHAETVYPQGMATNVKGNSGLRIQLHYLNNTEDTLHLSATLKLSPVDATTVSKWVNQLYLNYLYLSVPPGRDQSLTTQCSIPGDYGQIGLIGGGSHMHMRGTHFTAHTNSGTVLVDTDQWNEPPPIAYDPPILLNPKDTVTWTCTYNNEKSQPVIFGPSARDNEMCIYLARYYSSRRDATQIECEVGPLGGAAAPKQE